MQRIKGSLVVLLAALAGPALLTSAEAGERDRDRDRGHNVRHPGHHVGPGRLEHRRHKVHRKLGHHRFGHRKFGHHGRHRFGHPRGRAYGHFKHRYRHPGARRFRHHGGRYLPYWHRYRHDRYRGHGYRGYGYRGYGYPGYGVSFEIDGIRYYLGD